ncbi:uncharacterized protein LOC126611741 [Malus sylvestris]|uniref:uncharacterized protein LOC126611741 n=1 Tax=Malus sylvestris TaxID=3752 RepID=UPI0021ABACCE|nr:uncharacterized protein LOC126611741 [Malus sylvestris]
MDPTEVTPIVQLRPYTKADKIGVRVCRIWKSSVPGTVKKYVNLHCILVDEMNHAVEAFTKDIDYEVIASKIEAGSSYEIMNFRTIKIRGQDKVVAHETQIMLTATTLFKKLSNVFLPISRHNFFLQDYNSLYPRLNKVDILTDIPELNSYRSVFSNSKNLVKILPPSSSQLNEAKVLRTTRRVTIDELAFLDPDLHKDDTFLCKASVKRFDTRYNWWYSACPNCVKQMQKDSNTLDFLFFVTECN